MSPHPMQRNTSRDNVTFPTAVTTCRAAFALCCPAAGYTERRCGPGPLFFDALRLRLQYGLQTEPQQFAALVHGALFRLSQNLPVGRQASDPFQFLGKGPSLFDDERLRRALHTND
ncbi:MAG: hypothetical protein ACJ8FY_24375 [Gemmataceae bacterium]